ncbi:prostaglandin D2 receptor-like [Varanus komodoensis]|uniref:prostaglandin D2 receptor-like n=1 Tax=Varanus komodoensis TaxID=61221 RepID=UPI001CF77DF9|nr:prostaglandin D2 receptor-like [Varanus komodoensis]
MNNFTKSGLNHPTVEDAQKRHLGPATLTCSFISRAGGRRASEHTRRAPRRLAAPQPLRPPARGTQTHRPESGKRLSGSRAPGAPFPAGAPPFPARLGPSPPVGTRPPRAPPADGAHEAQPPLHGQVSAGPPSRGPAGGGARPARRPRLSMDGGAYRCRGSRSLEGGQSALPSSLLFAAGLLGNALALGLLWQHHLRARLQRAGGRPRASAFYLLVSALTATDLLGKCLLSPIVLAAYARNRSLSALWPAPAVEGAGEPGPGALCQTFAFLMAFFGLAPTALLLAMALECWLSLGHPYFYERYTSRRLGALLTGAGAALCALFCALPLLGFGATEQYCPGTWCFIRMAGGAGRPYSLLYASLLGALVLAVGLCNLGSMRSLYRMARRQPPRRGRPAAGGPSAAAPPGARRTEELAQLVLLALMTVLFTVCSLPVIIRAYIGAFAPDSDDSADLRALRFFSVNSIVDPWVFIIFRTSVFRSCLRRVSRRLSSQKAPHSHLLETWQRKSSGPLQ